MTGSTHAKHGSARSPRPTPERHARDNPITGPRTGTTRSEPSAPALAGASGRHNEPGSRPASACPAQPPSKAGGASPRGGKRHHGVGKADRSTESDRTGRAAAHPRGATRHAREARCRPQPRHKGRCQATTATGYRKPGQRAQHATNHGTGTGAREQPTRTPGVAGRSQNPSPSTHTPNAHPSQEWRGAAETLTQTHTPAPHTPARSGGVQAERVHQHTHSPTPQPGVAGRSQNPSPSTHMHAAHPGQECWGTRGAHTPTRTPRHPCQEWQGADETRAHTHTPTPHTPARSGRVQAERAHQPTHSPTPQPGVAGRSQNPSPSTHTQNAHPSQEWRGAAETRAHTHTPTPHTPARSGGVQAERVHQHTHSPTSGPGVGGRSRNPGPSTHTHATHPGQECRGTEAVPRAYGPWPGGL